MYQNAILRWLCCILLNFVLRSLAGQSKNRCKLWQSGQQLQDIIQLFTQAARVTKWVTKDWLSHQRATIFSQDLEELPQEAKGTPLKIRPKGKSWTVIISGAECAT